MPWASGLCFVSDFGFLRAEIVSGSYRERAFFGAMGERASVGVRRNCLPSAGIGAVARRMDGQDGFYRSASRLWLEVKAMSWQKSLMLGLCLGLGCISGWAQEPQGEGAVPDEGEASSEVRETTIYIPYERLRTLFEKEGRGVFLPYEKYRELWDAARRATARVPEAPIPA